jgi:hypothetical protein
MRIEDHAQQGTAAGTSAAVGEQGIVGENGADSYQDCVVMMPELVRMRASGFARDPVA